MFNITNFAQFENIEFTGEDNLFDIVNAHHADDKLLDIIKHAPFKFCDYAQEATSTLEDPTFTLGQGNNSNFEYQCFSGFNTTINAATNTVDEACAEDFPEEVMGVRSCQGEPAHEDFFIKTPYHYDSI